MNFKEWINNSVAHKILEIQKAIPKVKQFMFKILNIFKNESTVSLSLDVEHYILPSKEFIAYMQQYNTSVIKTKFGLNTKLCGQFGCAYFLANELVIKFSDDAQEFKIANAVKGNLELLPIIDAIEWEVEDWVMYSILMNKVDTNNISEAINAASEIIANECNILLDMIQSQDVSVEYIQARLSPNFIIQSNKDIGLDKETKKAIKDFAKILQLIYNKSGMIVGSDWASHNFGIHKKKIQPFDFGLAKPHDAKVDAIRKPEVKNIRL